jgi:hypothetical protein
MNYTEIYNKIYDCIKYENKENEQIHYTTVSMANAINELFKLLKQQNPQTAHAILEILSSMWNTLNINEFDLDDKNRQLFTHFLLE